MKKLLALVLALVMTLGLATVGTNAAISDMQDAADVYASEYDEAMEVMNAVGVFIGDGVNFRPNDKLDRASAAKLAAYFISNAKTAETMAATGTKFSDVKATDWFAGYVEYCASESVGVLAGDGSGKFNPSGELSVVAFAKMMLIALGYDAEAEHFVNSSEWAINVMRLANSQGLMSKLGDLKPTDTLTRAQAAQMAFNTVKTPTVEYATAPIKVTSETGFTVEVGGSKANYVTNTRATEQTISSEAVSNNAGTFFVEYGESHYPNLKLRGGNDNFGRPTNVWTSYAKNIGEWARDPFIVYTDFTYLSDMYADLGLTNNTATNIYQVDGAAAGNFTLAATDSEAAALNGNIYWIPFADAGSETWVYLGYGPAPGYAPIINVYQINHYPAKVTKFVAGKTGVNTVTINPLNLPANALGSVSFTTLDTFAVDDIVDYTAAEENGGVRYFIESIDKLTVSVSGVVTGWVGTQNNVNNVGTSSYFSVDGARQDYSLNCFVDNTEQSMTGFAAGKSKINVYNDRFGFALYVVGEDAMKNYALVMGYGSTNQYGSQFAGVTLMFPDGSVKEVKAIMSDGATNPTTVLTNGIGGVGGLTPANTVNTQYGDLVSYTESNGVYYLTLVSSYTASLGTTETFETGKSALTLGGTGFYATEKTTFFVAKQKTPGVYTYSVYQGINNMLTLDDTFVAPATNANANTIGYAVITNAKNSKQADIVFVAVDSVKNAVASMYFVKATSATYNPITTEMINGKQVSYYTLPAVIDGEVTTIKVMNTCAVTVGAAAPAQLFLNNGTNAGLYAVTGITKDANGIIIAMSTNNALLAENGTRTTTRPGAGVLGVGNSAYAYNSKTQAFSINSTYSSIGVSSMANITDDVNDQVYVVTDANGNVVAVMVAACNKTGIVNVTHDDATVSAATPYLKAGTTLTVLFDGEISGATITYACTGTVTAAAFAAADLDAARTRLDINLTAAAMPGDTITITGLKNVNGTNIGINYTIEIPDTWDKLANNYFVITAI